MQDSQWLHRHDNCDTSREEDWVSKQLILTGWGRSDYVAAAAVALKAIGEADVLGVSMRWLAYVLEKESVGHEVVYVLGVGLERHPRLQHRKRKAGHQGGRTEI